MTTAESSWVSGDMLNPKGDDSIKGPEHFAARDLREFRLCTERDEAS